MAGPIFSPPYRTSGKLRIELVFGQIWLEGTMSFRTDPKYSDDLIGCPWDLLPFPDFLQLRPQVAESSNQASQINAVNHPCRDIGRKQEFDRVHRGLRFSGRLGLDGVPAPTSDSIA
jgi:hypothetical protein